MRYYLIAGEASGDIYGAKLIESIKQTDPEAKFRFWGGDLMLAQSNNIAMHYSKTSFMGFWEVIKNIRTIRKMFVFCKEDITKFKPDCLICIDYPGFNLRMTEWAKSKGIHTVYYIAPQLWAWKKSRYKKIKAYVDQLFVILPFEKGFYKGLGIEANYYGHPLAQEIKSKAVKQINAKSLKIAVLAGSRKQELLKHIPVIVALCKLRLKDQFYLALANEVTVSEINAIINAELPSNLSLVEGATRDVIRKADIAIVKSGTSTLETALIGTPQIVIYKTSKLSYAIGKRLVKLQWISLVNIISGKEIVKELIQDDCNANTINEEINLLLNKPNGLKDMQSEYLALRESLAGEDCYKNVATEIYKGIS